MCVVCILRLKELSSGWIVSVLNNFLYRYPSLCHLLLTSLFSFLPSGRTRCPWSHWQRWYPRPARASRTPWSCRAFWRGRRQGEGTRERDSTERGGSDGRWTLPNVFILQGEVGMPGHKGSKGDKGDAVSGGSPGRVCSWEEIWGGLGSLLPSEFWYLSH